MTAADAARLKKKHARDLAVFATLAEGLALQVSLDEETGLYAVRTLAGQFVLAAQFQGVHAFLRGYALGVQDCLRSS